MFDGSFDRATSEHVLWVGDKSPRSLFIILHQPEIDFLKYILQRVLVGHGFCSAITVTVDALIVHRRHARSGKMEKIVAVC